MLTKMYLTNFRSFKERTEFNFTATKSSILEKTNVYEGKTLKGALLIGPNASGKSNALEGISFLINLLKGEDTFFYRDICHFTRSPIFTTEYEFLINNKKVEYKIECNLIKKSISEQLSIEGNTVLSRNGSDGDLRINDTYIQDNQLDNFTLFLRTASFNTGRFPQEPTLHALMEYLFNSYIIDGYNFKAPIGKNISKYAEENGVEKLNSYLHEFQYDFYVEYGSTSTGEGVSIAYGQDRKGIFMKRKSFPVPAFFVDESQGNQVFIDFLPQLVSVIENPGMLIYDEFGNSLHNYLAEKIVAFFMRNAKNSQMFITSHDTNLISNSVFRPDQINIVQFVDKKGSKVERLSKYKPREAQNLEKMYLGGMFEGLPVYEELSD